MDADDLLVFSTSPSDRDALSPSINAIDNRGPASFESLTLGSSQDMEKATSVMTPTDTPALEVDGSFDAFKEDVEAEENEKQAKEKNKASRYKSEINLQKRKGLRQQLKRTQRYLGLAAPEAGVPLRAAHDAPILFVAVDIEAFEFNQRILTEFGISTLSTSDIAKVPRGTAGNGWAALIHSRHIRIIEYQKYTNQVHVENNAENFAWGKTEWVSIRDIIPVLEAAFNPANFRKHRTVFVAHNKGSEFKYLSELGFDLKQHVDDCIDSSDIFQAAGRKSSQSALFKILQGFDIPAPYLHNAGNDARYTLHGMIAIAVDHTTNKKTVSDWETERDKRLAIAYKEAEERVNAELEGWSSADDESDGDGPTEVARAAKMVQDRKQLGTGKTKEVQSTRGGTNGRGRGQGRGRGRGRGMASENGVTPPPTHTPYERYHPKNFSRGSAPVRHPGNTRGGSHNRGTPYGDYDTEFPNFRR